MMTKTIMTLFIASFAMLQFASAEPDFGDFSSETLTTKAWEGLNADKPADAIIFAKKCIAMYEKDAIKMQSELKEPMVGENDIVASKWALNDVGTCYFILGKAYEAQKKNKEAEKAYKALVANVSFAQCWDPNGWFWAPADSAKERIAALEFDSDESTK